MALWVRVPLQPEAASCQPPGTPPAVPMDADSGPNGSTAASPPLQQPQQQDGASPGQLWNQLQTLTGFSNRLGVLLEVGVASLRTRLGVHWQQHRLCKSRA